MLGATLEAAKPNAGPDASEQARPERIAELADALVGKMKRATSEICHINDRTHLLSLNARIEAARAGGTTGAAFGVVASAISSLSDKTSRVADTMTAETEAASAEIHQLTSALATSVRGTRLSDLALANIDLVDRNLYERSCDVRWWATDSSAVDALAQGTDEACRFCAHRLGAILRSYTVYYDLVLCDLEGRVVANGRPDQFRTNGMSCRGADWFQSALTTATGEKFGFQGVHVSPLVNSKRVLVFSCVVRTGGEVGGSPLGVLGIVFNWDALAQTIVQNVPLGADEKRDTRVCIVDGAGRILADSQNRQLLDTLPLTQWPQFGQSAKGYVMTTLDGLPCCVGHAASPGYETYATGWHSLLIQRVR